MDSVLADVINILTQPVQTMPEYLDFGGGQAGQQRFGQMLLKGSALFDNRLSLIGAQKLRFAAVARYFAAAQQAFSHQSVHMDGNNSWFQTAAAADIPRHILLRMVGQIQQNIQRQRRQTGITSKRQQYGMVGLDKLMSIVEKAGCGSGILKHRNPPLNSSILNHLLLYELM